MDMDDAIQGFVDAFVQLKSRFDSGVGIDTWKIARSIQDGMVQFVTTGDKVKVIGKISFQQFN